MTANNKSAGRGEDPEGNVEYVRASREPRHALIISDPQPVEQRPQSIWASLGQAANIGIFLLLFGGVLYVGREILLPILIAAVVALTLAPLIKAGKRHGISPWITGILIVALAVGALAPGRDGHRRPGERVDRPRAAKSAPPSSRSSPCSIRRSRRCANCRPRCSARRCGAGQTAAPNVVLPVVAFLTPAAGELLLFFGTLLFFSAGQIELRNRFVSMFSSQRGAAALPAHHQRHREEPRRLSGRGDHDQRRARRRRRIRSMAHRSAQPGDLRCYWPRCLNYVPYVGPAIMVDDSCSASGLVTFPLARPRAHRARRRCLASARWKDISSRRPSSAGG